MRADRRKDCQDRQASRFPSIQAATKPTRLVLLQTIAYIQALGIHSLSYMMPSRSLAAKASVLNGNFVDDVALTVAMEQDFAKDGFYNDFPKLLGFFYGYRGLGGASGLHSGQPGRRRVGKGDEFNKAALAPAAPLPAPAAPAPAAGENGAPPPDEPPTPPACEGAEAGAGDPAPCEGVVQCLVASKPGCLLRMKNKASISLSKSLSCCARYLAIPEIRAELSLLIPTYTLAYLSRLKPQRDIPGYPITRILSLHIQKKPFYTYFYLDIPG